MMLLRRSRYRAPVAEHKRISAELSNHLGYKIHAAPQLCKRTGIGEPGLRRIDLWKSALTPGGRHFVLFSWV
jgi:hypothetical protein